LKSIPWDKIKLVVFDVDGTLYDQSRLRKKMFFKICGYYFFRPWKWKEIYILYQFRKQREMHAGAIGGGIETLQYEWCASVVGTSAEHVKVLTDKWIQQVPLRFLHQCRFEGVEAFFQELRREKISTAIYSDYPADLKLQALELDVDMVACSTQPEIDALKPAPNGINFLLQNLGILPNECLYIGDRQDLDGASALNAGVLWLLVKKGNTLFFKNLLTSFRESIKR
jgi:phosphoglycolate phosphatase/putative hydrolase of the HAD superfamily